MSASNVDGLPVYELAEWTRREAEGVRLSEADRRLAGELSAGGTGRLVVEELRSGVRVSATSWVGVVRFERFEVRVVPKLVGGDLGLVEMVEFAMGLDALRRIPGVRTLSAEGRSLLDLVALLLAEECERIARGGLLADYVEAEDELPAVRGRLLGDRQVLQKFGRVDRVICRYDELVQDVAENQVLAAALEKCAKRVTSEEVRLRAGRMRSLFAEACSPEKLNPEAARRQMTYNRMNAHYRDAHALSWLILDGLRALKDIYTPDRARCFAFMIDMNLLFEMFVRRLLERALDSPSYAIDYQRADRSIIWDADKNRPYSRVIPDLLVRSRRHPSRAVAVDAKYKLYDERKVSPADLYQSFLYAYAYGAESGGETPSAVIVYPATAGAGRAINLRVRSAAKMEGARISAVGISIPECLAWLAGGKTAPSVDAIKEALRAS
ncbi:MAG TPA: hypothetical protein VIP46_16880 [Pyrinomonadaceae bacterium]